MSDRLAAALAELVDAIRAEARSEAAARLPIGSWTLIPRPRLCRLVGA